MKLGEWLLTHHGQHRRQLQMVNERIAQRQNALVNVHETIEQLALHKRPLDKPAAQAGFSDLTPGIALNYEGEMKKVNGEVEAYMAELIMTAEKLQDYVDVFNIIVNGFDENDRWFIARHFVDRDTISSLKTETFPDGKTNSKSTIQTMKNRIIEEVTQACELLHFWPSEFRDDT